MGIQRASVLYPVNSATTDTGAGIDVRFLDDVQAGATDSDQSVRFTHTQDGQERTFDPDNALVTTEADPLVFQGDGWALAVPDDMTPADDTNCNAMLSAGTLTVNVRALLNMNGGTNLGGVTTITFRASLWRSDPITESNALIASGSQSQTWDTSVLGAENNTRKNTAISIAIASNVEFTTGETLMLQIGCEGTTLPNATVGTTNFDVTLDVDDAATNITFAAGQGIRQACSLSGNPVGTGTVTRGANALEISRTPVGKGVVTSTKATIASKSFDLVGKGVITEVHPVQAFRTFDLTGKGTVDGTITIPLDEVPTGGGPSGGVKPVGFGGGLLGGT